jgi:4-alpha-glucanotransferase
LDDITGEEEQLNLPGTVSEHKNWCRKLSKKIEDINLRFKI